MVEKVGWEPHPTLSNEIRGVNEEGARRGG